MLLGAGGAVAGGVVGGIGRPLSDASRAARTPQAALIPVSMAMHIHGPFSEGIASYEAHLSEAHRIGVDMVWWTDHDFRIDAHGYQQAVHFDGPVEKENGVAWTWTQHRTGPLRSASGTFVAQPHSPDEQGRALRLQARADHDTWGELWYTGTAWNWTYSTCLADTTLELDVRASQVGPDAVLAVEIDSSYHPAVGSRPAGQYTLRYRIGGTSTVRRRARGLLGIVELPAPRGHWRRVALRPVRDIAAIWPELVAADNSLYQLRIGVLSRRGHPVDVVVDRLRFRRTQRDPTAALALRRSVLRHYAGRFPGVRQSDTAEISLVRHLNWFGGELVLPPYPAGAPRKDGSVAAAQAMVQFIKSHGGIASYNHPMQGDVGSPQALSRLLITTRALGADIVEIGCKQTLDSLLQVFDVSARNAVYYTATGVTDDHSGINWIKQRVNFLTYVWSHSFDVPDLVSALTAGRAWFVDPAKWRGELDLQVRGVPAMGGVLVGAASTEPVRIIVTGVPKDGALEIVTGPVDRAGPAPARSADPPADRARGPARPRTFRRRCRTRRRRLPAGRRTCGRRQHRRGRQPRVAAAGGHRRRTARPQTAGLSGQRKRRGASSTRLRRQVSHSCAVPGER